MQDRPKPSAPIRYQHGTGPQIHPARRTALGDWAGKPTSAALCKRPNGPLKPPSHRPSAHFTHSITKTLVASTLGGFPTRVVRPSRPHPHAATRIRKPSPLPFDLRTSASAPLSIADFQGRMHTDRTLDPPPLKWSAVLARKLERWTAPRFRSGFYPTLRSI